LPQKDGSGALPWTVRESVAEFVESTQLLSKDRRPEVVWPVRRFSIVFSIRTDSDCQSMDFPVFFWE